MERLKLKHIAPYLQHDLRFFYKGNNGEINSNHDETIDDPDFLGSIDSIDLNSGIILSNDNGVGVEFYYHEIQLLLRSMDDLNISHFAMIEICDIHSCEYNGNNTFVDLSEEYNNDPYDVKYLCHEAFDILLQYNFDVFGLIEKGLAIDINTIDNG